ncbi:hypothetical protein [Stakelama pacifica]|uniref:Uncharacterized protein n=1 Tax=Stakelama pacifica TaxID=517720 RepID=A0A4R6FDR0_9SPHN|nr:hypothetical protein [Stakelama pacifica]TDN78800.1 hypothetical protein EV664_11564 [Stakelama pacifica]GGO99068.1 hypothetical protein GCM10011329_31690 [Stakelama pacifica]
METTQSLTIGRMLATAAGVVLVGLVVALAYLSIFGWLAWNALTPDKATPTGA